MPKFDEETKCHFFDEECRFLISEEDLKNSLDDIDEGDSLASRPYEYTITCTNCLLAKIFNLIFDIYSKNDLS